MKIKFKDDTVQTIKCIVIGHAIGDALGVPVEFASREYLQKNSVTDMISYGVHNKPLGTWSDDTSMTICLLESLCRLNRIEYSDIMNNFILWINEGKFTPDNQYAFGIGRTCYKAIQKYVQTEGKSLLEGCSGIKENGNGSLMRIAPACIFLLYKNFDEDEKLTIIHNISALTHSHPISKIACGIYYFIIKTIMHDFERTNIRNTIFKALQEAVKYYNNKEEFSEYINYYNRIFKANFYTTIMDDINSSGYVVDTLEAVIWCLENTDSYEKAVLKAVNLGGDTDTIGAITGGLAGLYYGYNNIPKKWKEKLRGKEWLNIADNMIFEV